MKHNLLKSFTSWIAGLSPREKFICGLAIAGSFAYFIIYLPAISLQEHLAENERTLLVRQHALEELQGLLGRYIELTGRLEKVQSTFDESQMTYEQVTAEIDRIAKAALEGDECELGKRSSSTLPKGYQKQDFVLKCKNLTTKHLVKLLFDLENDKNPLFVGKVQVSRRGRGGKLQGTIEISTIGKQA